jgi:hypothetical protein
VAQIEQPFVLELVVRLGDGIGADDQLFGERADAGKLICCMSWR